MKVEKKVIIGGNFERGDRITPSTHQICVDNGCLVVLWVAFDTCGKMDTRKRNIFFIIFIYKPNV